MIFHQFVIYVLIEDYIKLRKDPSIIYQEKANYISVALAVALSVYLRNRSALAVNCCVIIHCLEVSCKEDQITSAQRE